jgi:hypothetical protein
MTSAHTCRSWNDSNHKWNHPHEFHKAIQERSTHTSRDWTCSMISLTLKRLKYGDVPQMQQAHAVWCEVLLLLWHAPWSTTVIHNHHNNHNHLEHEDQCFKYAFLRGRGNKTRDGGNYDYKKEPITFVCFAMRWKNKQDKIKRQLKGHNVATQIVCSIFSCTNINWCTKQHWWDYVNGG